MRGAIHEITWAQQGTHEDDSAGDLTDDPDPEQSHLALLTRVVSGDFDPRVLESLKNGSRVFLRNEGTITLERCLKLPRTPCKLRQARRDYFLREAWTVLEGGSPWLRTVALAREVRRFEADIWPRWKNMTAPPEGCSTLRLALWHAFKFGRVPGTPEGLDRIVRY